MPKRQQTLPKKPEPDTEPDDAFSLVLGDVHHSPLMRHGQGPHIPEAQAPEPATAVDVSPRDSRQEQDSAPSALENPLPENPQAGLFSEFSGIDQGPHSAGFRHPGLPCVTSSTPPAEPEQNVSGMHGQNVQEQPQNSPQDSPQGLHPWLEVQLDTCTVTPDPGVLAAPDEQAQEALRQALVAAMQQQVAVVRLNLGRATIAPRVLALALDCSRHLQARDKSRRLVLANCPDALRSMFKAMRLQEKHDIAYS